jgi:hypothetical protein
METMDSTKMDADKLAKNTPNAQNLSAQIVCPSPKVWDFDEKRLHWGSVVRACSMAILVVEFSREGYKIGKSFG